MICLSSGAGLGTIGTMFKPGTVPSRPVTASRLKALLGRFDLVMDLNMPGLALEGVEITGSAFYGCNFAQTDSRKNVVSDCTFELCFFEFSTLSNLTFSNVKMKNCVFGGSRIRNTTFRGSNVIQCNFNGIHADSLLFDDCDLLHTRIDTSVLRATTFDNCNLKQTRFVRTDIQDVVFRYANQEDAIFNDEGMW